MARAVMGTGPVSNKPCRDLTSAEKLLARHMARDDYSIHDIARAIDWPLSIQVLRKKLYAINIKPKGKYIVIDHRHM